MDAASSRRRLARRAHPAAWEGGILKFGALSEQVPTCLPAPSTYNVQHASPNLLVQTEAKFKLELAEHAAAIRPGFPPFTPDVLQGQARPIMV